jgi:hypothetical protein
MRATTASKNRNHFQVFEDAFVAAPEVGLRDESFASVGGDGGETRLVAWFCTPVPSATHMSDLKLRESTFPTR